MQLLGGWLEVPTFLSWGELCGVVMPQTYVPNYTRLQLGTLVGSVVNTDDVVLAMVETGNEDLYVPGITDATGGVVELRVLNAGSGYTDGSYNGVELRDTGSATGLFATADLQFSGGSLVFAVVQNPGQAYKSGDQVTVDAADVGGTGSGLLFEVVLIEPQMAKAAPAGRAAQQAKAAPAGSTPVPDLIASANTKTLQQIIDTGNLGVDLSRFSTLKLKREAVLLAWKIDQGLIQPGDPLN